MGRTTMWHVLAQSVAVEGLENEKKVFGSATEAQKNVPEGHLRPRPRTKFVPEGTFFVVTPVIQSHTCTRVNNLVNVQALKHLWHPVLFICFACGKHHQRN